jgi:hypothetical protein
VLGGFISTKREVIKLGAFKAMGSHGLIGHGEAIAADSSHKASSNVALVHHRIACFEVFHDG